MLDTVSGTAASRLPSPPTDDPLMLAARQLEGAFLAEMLGAAGLGAPRDSFGGGAGEAQFASLLRDMQAREYAEAGGIGLAEAIYRSLLTGDAADG